MNKPKANKLDPFAERLVEWEREGKTLDEIRASADYEVFRAAEELGIDLSRRPNEGAMSVDEV